MVGAEWKVGGGRALRDPGRSSMSQVVIENPIINSPFDEPTRHFRFSDEGITDEIGDGRRTSSYFVPIAKSKKKGSKQLQFDTEWTQDRIEENKLVNDIRRRVALWRKGGYVGVTTTTARLIAYWTDPNREKKLFFCQNEALETAIYIAEVAKKYGDAWIENAIREANDTSNPGLPRTAFKMATGSGKTVVMAMLIAWHTLNKRTNPRDARFSDTFLIVTPGITIRDRLRVLLPNDPGNYYASVTLYRPNCRTSSDRPKSSSPTTTPFNCVRGSPPERSQSRFSPMDSQARLPKLPTRWCAASVASWVPRKTSSFSTTKPITATAANLTARMKSSPAMIALKPSNANKRLASGFPALRP